MIYNNYSHMAEVNAAMFTNADWIAFQQSVDAQPEMAATLKYLWNRSNGWLLLNLIIYL